MITGDVCAGWTSQRFKREICIAFENGLSIVVDAKTAELIEEQIGDCIWADSQETRSELKSKIESLEEEHVQLVEALAEMCFAYVNGDQENPHDYEESAYRAAEEILTENGKAWLSWEDFRKMYDTAQ